MRPVLAAVVLLAAASAGCGHNVGDNCRTNVDCSPAGDRFCDTSAPNGYCTIDSCDQTSCPDEAVCIRFLTPVLNRPCTFDAAHPNSQSDCNAGERCVCDATTASGCTNGLAHCAPEASERRWCQYKCSDDSDCRVGYQCRRTGTLGAEPVPTTANPAGAPAMFCAPRG
jgi:hypothetical protein